MNPIIKFNFKLQRSKKMVLTRKLHDNDIYDLSKSFALRIVRLYKYLTDNKKEYVISKQLLRAGTSIGANVHEAKNAQTRPDFATKMNIALKEATESQYWLELLHDADYIDDKEFISISEDCDHVTAVLVKIVKATKRT